ncbi:MAG: SGNH/GDSL hydrolase family protein [Novosphingobium sp.]|nr:SGNH/GDSL hydrolase family protein [Novosphingobium sp.]
MRYSGSPIWKALCAGAAALALVSGAQAQDTSNSLAGGRYVAMGSSFAAGSGGSQVKYNTPQRCGRSYENYATLLAEGLRMLLVDVTCGGATTAHVLGAWNELPPQIDAVTPDTDLVTITVGGNDIGYVGYLIAESCKVRGPIQLGAAGTVCPQVSVPDDAAWFKLENDLRTIAEEVRKRAPNARLIFVQYLEMVPPYVCADSPLSPEAAKIGRDIGLRLAQITDRVAKEAGAEVLGFSNTSKKRLACGGKTAWVTGWPAGYQPGDTFPWHPTRAGHSAIARQLLKGLR